MQAGRMQAKDGGMMLQTIYCRSVQAGMALALRLLPWRQPQCLCGAGAVLRVPELLAAAGLSRPLLVTGPHIAASGLLTPLCAALEAAAAGIACGEKPAAAAQAFRREVAALGRRLGLPAGFACIRQQDLPQLAAAVLAEAHPLYAVPRLLDRRACQALLQALAAEGGQTAADSFPAAEKREEISS